MNGWQLILSTLFVLAPILATPPFAAAPPQSQATVHVVQAGEHLTAIASANNLVNIQLLHAG